MNITYTAWLPKVPGERTRRIGFQWEKRFDDDDILNLALGYVYGLLLARTEDTSIRITQGRMTITNPLDLLAFQSRIVGRGVSPPNIGQSIKEYLFENNQMRGPNMRFVLIVKITMDSVDVIEFDSTEFLQGLISVLTAFQTPLSGYLLRVDGADVVELSIE